MDEKELEMHDSDSRIRLEVLDSIFVSLGGDPTLSDEELKKKCEKIREEVRARRVSFLDSRIRLEVLDSIFVSLGGDPTLSDEELKKKCEKIREEVRVRLQQQKNKECDYSDTELSSMQPKRNLRCRKPVSYYNAMRSKWTAEEENDFIRKTFEIGTGHWIKIKAGLKSLRSTQQLRDKWRNIPELRKSAIKKEYGPVVNDK